MRNKLLAVFSAIGLVILFTCFIIRTDNGAFDGSTRQSREAILSSKGNQTEWHINSETEVNGYLVCAIASQEEIGIALFEPLKNGNYGFVTWIKRELNEIVSLPVQLNQAEYLLLFADIPNPDYAEAVFTVDEDTFAPVRLEATSGEVLVTELPNRNYSAEIVYYDTDGNRYE